MGKTEQARLIFRHMEEGIITSGETSSNYSLILRILTLYPDTSQSISVESLANEIIDSMEKHNIKLTSLGYDSILMIEADACGQAAFHASQVYEQTLSKWEQFFNKMQHEGLMPAKSRISDFLQATLRIPIFDTPKDIIIRNAQLLLSKKSWLKKLFDSLNQSDEGYTKMKQRWERVWKIYEEALKNHFKRRVLL